MTRTDEGDEPSSHGTGEVGSEDGKSIEQRRKAGGLHRTHRRSISVEQDVPSSTDGSAEQRSLEKRGNVASAQHERYDPKEDPNAQPLDLVVEQSVYERHEGPIPDPGTLAGYEQISPGLADRIVAMTELEMQSRVRERDSRVKDNSRIVEADTRSVVVATRLVGLLPYAVVLLTLALATLGESVAASYAAIATMVSFGPKIIAAIKGSPTDDVNRDAR